MNSWEIKLFVKLMHNLTDRDSAAESMNKDDECRDGILARGAIKELREAGVIQ